MVPGALDLPGEGLDVLAQRGKMLGNRLDILAEYLLARHFGVFRGHLVLLFLLPIDGPIAMTVKTPFRLDENQAERKSQGAIFRSAPNPCRIRIRHAWPDCDACGRRSRGALLQ